jgi:ligand-binding sensor domain-containing protein
MIVNNHPLKPKQIGGISVLLFVLLACCNASALTPEVESVYTSTRYVTGIAVAPDNSLWVSTRGGILRRSPEGLWRKFTRQDGLPAHEVLSVRLEGDGTCLAVFPETEARWQNERWEIKKIPSASEEEGNERKVTWAAETIWRGERYIATPDGLHVEKGRGQTDVPPLLGSHPTLHAPSQGEGKGEVGEGPGVRSIPLPPSRGTHISALLPRGDRLWVALFGDGLWTFDGKEWRIANVGLPAGARDITALAGNATTLFVGTRRAGLWEYDGKTWRQHLQPEEPAEHNAQAIAAYGENLFVSTLEDGLMVRTASGWQHLTAPELSSALPRQMVTFQGQLYLRHSTGKVDRFDGQRWERDIFAGFPRADVATLAADQNRLVFAQWGGWSEGDGKTWNHYLDIPDLQGRTPTCLLPDGDTLWVGVQGRGLLEFHRPTGKLRWHDERKGLPDDWVTCLARVGSTLYAGTYIGGLARYDGARWTDFPALRGDNVTALAPDADGGMYVATRRRVHFLDKKGEIRAPDVKSPLLDTEAQALCLMDGGLWIGSRTGLAFLPLRHR